MVFMSNLPLPNHVRRLTHSRSSRISFPLCTGYALSVTFNKDKTVVRGGSIFSLRFALTWIGHFIYYSTGYSRQHHISECFAGQISHGVRLSRWIFVWLERRAPNVPIIQKFWNVLISFFTQFLRGWLNSPRISMHFSPVCSTSFFLHFCARSWRPTDRWGHFGVWCVVNTPGISNRLGWGDEAPHSIR